MLHVSRRSASFGLGSALLLGGMSGKAAAGELRLGKTFHGLRDAVAIGR